MWPGKPKLALVIGGWWLSMALLAAAAGKPVATLAPSMAAARGPSLAPTPAPTVRPRVRSTPRPLPNPLLWARGVALKGIIIGEDGREEALMEIDGRAQLFQAGDTIQRSGYKIGVRRIDGRKLTVLIEDTRGHRATLLEPTPAPYVRQQGGRR